MLMRVSLQVTIGLVMVLVPRWGGGEKAMAGWLCPELQIHEEGIAMLKVMKWVQQMGLSRMTFLSDSQVLVAAIFTRTEGQSEFNIIV